MVTKEREKLHRLIDQLPESEMHTAERFLEYLRDSPTDPVLKAFMEAPLDDEPLTPEEEAAAKEAEEAAARGEVITLDEYEARLHRHPQ